MQWKQQKMLKGLTLLIIALLKLYSGIIFLKIAMLKSLY